MSSFTAYTGRKNRFSFVLALVFVTISFYGFSQNPGTEKVHTVVAGKQYKRTGMHNWLWGAHYRKDWATSVVVPTINLDTVHGGLTAYEKGGGRQSKTLRLHSPEGREYVLRSIDKSFGKALPKIAQGTFAEHVANDQVSISEPYSAITIAPMADAVGIYHTNPQIVFVPKQKALGEFNEEYGNDLYLFEQRPDENWEDAANFGFSKNIVGTDKMLEKILKDNDNSVDQPMYVRARLFDMFIGDWGRHEDQWRWASFKDGDKTVYRPIPRDRDQAYSKTEGFLLKPILSAVGDYIEGFGNKIQDVPLYNFTARNLDRKLMIAVPRDQWISIATEMQIVLSDKVIEESIHKLPPEIAKNSAAGLISILKQRRGKLVEWAIDQYEALAETVNVTGTSDDEYFEISKLSADETLVQVYDLNKEGAPKKSPFYSRKFITKETDEIRIYGISGHDQFHIENKSGNPVVIRIIGGPMKDSYISTGGNSKVIVYDNHDNDFTKLSNTSKHLSEDSAVNKYVYDAFKYDKRNFGISPSYNEDDKIFIQLKYTLEKQQFRKQPFGYHHEFAARYSITEKAPSVGYTGIYTKAICNWDLLLNANYDWVRTNNYYGIGNETINTKNPLLNYNKVRHKQLDASIGLGRTLGKYNYVTIGGFYQTIKILDDEDRYLHKQVPLFKEYDTKKFFGGAFEYTYQNVNNTVLPTKGLRFNANARYTQNTKMKDSTVSNFSGVLHFFIPLGNSIVIANRTTGATLTGKPEFYQLSKLGGGRTLRGFKRNRFYGESMVSNQSELQIVPNIKSYLFNGRAGIIGFYDVGRVWQPGETSDTWHVGYGGGIVISPFNKVALAVFYGLSKDERAIAIRLNAGF